MTGETTINRMGDLLHQRRAKAEAKYVALLRRNRAPEPGDAAELEKVLETLGKSPAQAARASSALARRDELLHRCETLQADIDRLNSETTKANTVLCDAYRRAISVAIADLPLELLQVMLNSFDAKVLTNDAWKESVATAESLYAEFMKKWYAEQSMLSSVREDRREIVELNRENVELFVWADALN